MRQRLLALRKLVGDACATLGGVGTLSTARISQRGTRE
jgi:hypothetical protein